MFVENSFCQHIGLIAIANIAVNIHRIKPKSVFVIITIITTIKNNNNNNNINYNNNNMKKNV